MSINPDIQKNSSHPKEIDYYTEGIESQNRFVLSETITLIESKLPAKKELGFKVLQRVTNGSSNSIRIGITGSPGVGKSTLLNTLGMNLIEKGHKVAVLAIDPSSTSTKGSILGDKTRMHQLSQNKNAFIRPTATNAFLGGIASSTMESILLCEAAGFDVVFVETVGVGQSEVLVASVVDLFMLLILPGSGDDIQGIKRGIMEMADLIVINKADGEQKALAEMTKKQFVNALQLLRNKIDNWNPRIVECSGLEGFGLEELWQGVQDFIELSKETNHFFTNRKQQELSWFENKYKELILESFYEGNDNRKYMLNLHEQIKESKINALEAYQMVNKRVSR